MSQDLPTDTNRQPQQYLTREQLLVSEEPGQPARYGPDPPAPLKIQAVVGQAQKLRALVAEPKVQAAFALAHEERRMQRMQRMALHRGVVDAQIQLIEAYRAARRAQPKDAQVAAERKMAPILRRVRDTQIQLIKAHLVQSFGRPRVASPSCQGRAPRVATNTRVRGSRRSTSTSTSRGDPDEPPPALAGSPRFSSPWRRADDRLAEKVGRGRR
jgi:hypothetical protein